MQEAADCLTKIFKVHGVPPRGISSDRGAAFTSAVSYKLQEIFKFQWRHASSKSPPSCGLIESRVRLTRNLLKYAMLAQPQLTVTKALPDVVYSINNAESSTTGLSSHEIFMGWPCIDPVECSLGADLPGGAVHSEKLKLENELRHKLVKQSREL